jgi:molybdate transport system substrate-binding protein
LKLKNIIKQLLRLTLFFLCLSTTAYANSPAKKEVVVATAANFQPTLQKLADIFYKKTGVAVSIASAASGILYLQILHGAPYDIFLSADSRYPQLLEHSSAVSDRDHTPFLYARGQLALWAPHSPQRILNENALKTFKSGSIAIADPQVAPYGAAAQEALKKLKLWDPLSSHFVQGTNIDQTFNFIATGNAEMGFVAVAQLMQNNLASRNPPTPFSKGEKMKLEPYLLNTTQSSKTVWVIPQSFYSPILQEGLLLKHAQNNPSAVAFQQFLLSPEAQKIIQEAGYA